MTVRSLRIRNSVREKEYKEEKRSFSTKIIHYSLFTIHYSFKYPNGGVAQLGEHLPCKQGVMGSIPIISTRSTVSTAKIDKASANIVPDDVD